MKETSRRLAPKLLFPLAIILGIGGGLLGSEPIYLVAETVSGSFVNLLKLVSLPIIFLSIISTISGMKGLEELKDMGKKVLKYTLLTTVIAAFVALGLFLTFNPVRTSVAAGGAPSSTVVTNLENAVSHTSYLKHITKLIPSNFIQPFIEGNVISILLLAMLLSFAILSLPNEKRALLHDYFSSIYAAVMKITGWVVLLMPIAIWSFVTLFVREVNAGLEFKNLGIYLLCIVLANLIQAFIILPLLLKSRGISSLKVAKAMFPALSVAFWSKSSSATLPIAMKCAEDRLGLSKSVSQFSLPLCTTINMNACAAFILITVLFVSISHGVTYNPVELILWGFIATIAAVGNAGVPMGCYFLSSALLASMNVPLYVLGIILPFYSMIDMLETAINVWSDACVTTIVDKEVKVALANEAATVLST